MSADTRAAVGPQTAIEDVLGFLRDKKSIGRNIVRWSVTPPVEAVYADWPARLSPELIELMRARGAERLYSHQADAIEATLAGRNVIIVTPTASGKTLCYNLPVLQRLIENPEARALYLFPTKALAQDQYVGLHEMAGKLGRDIKMFTYDGDTPASARSAIRSAGQIVLTNADMLHSGILPNHTKWVKLFENLETIVIDETHQYRGVFGAHAANVIRRLRRICRFYGSDPKFILCSATVANPLEMAEKLIEAPFELVDRNGAPRGERIFIFYNPPVVNQELGVRASSVKEARHLAIRFMERGLQTIIFAKSRTRVEILTQYLKRAMMRLGRNPEQVKAYRGGYLANERRAIEKGLRNGTVLGVVSTNALELGIDIGSLQVSILVGYPGTVASTWQQAGRAGRQSQTAVVVLVGASSPVDQFLMNSPDFLLGRSPENAIINPDNIAILASHVKCALAELPMSEGEAFGPTHPEAMLDYFVEEGIARRAGGRVYWSAEVYPAEEVSLRTATPQNFTIHDTTDRTRILAETDYDSAQELIHPQAIYMHQGQTYHVDELDWERRRCYIRRVDVDYYTDAVTKSDLFVLSEDMREERGGPGAESRAGENVAPENGGADPVTLPPADPEARRAWVEAFRPLAARSFGDVKVTTVTPKFKKVKFETHESVGIGDISLPERELQTEAMWWTFRPETAEWLKAQGLELGGALKGLAWAVRNVASLFIMSDPRDLAAQPMTRAPFDCMPALYLHDRIPGGIGLARRAWGLDRQILRAALAALEGCPCGEGCPSCAGPSLEVGDRAKAGALALARAMLRE